MTAQKTITIVKRNKLRIYGAPTYCRREIAKTLSLDNPLYHKLVQLGKIKALYGVKKVISYYAEKEKDTIDVGRGVEERVIRYLEKQGYATNVVDRTCRGNTRTTITKDITLRDYQRPIIKQLEEKIKETDHGVIRLDTGWGKSVVALHLAKYLKQKTLIIVPRGHLLEQYKKDAKKFYNIDVGIIQGKKCNIQDITIATIQTLDSNNYYLEMVKDKFGCVIVDECHQFITKKRLHVIQRFFPKYLFGMTATPEREDGQAEAIAFTFGEVLVDGKLPTLTPSVSLVHTNIKIPMGEYHDIIEAQCSNEGRNKLIANIALDQMRLSKRVLILSKRIAHAQNIAQYLPEKGVHSISSKLKTNERHRLLSQLRHSDQFTCILGTFSLLSTGTDIPALDTLIIAGDLKSSVLHTQSVGRILRLFDTKSEAQVIDIVDNLNPILFNQAKKRIKLYKENNWKMV